MRKKVLVLPVLLRGCPDCGCGMEPIQVSGSWRFRRFSMRRRWWRGFRREPEGRLAAWLCPGCRRVHFYAATR